MKTIDVKKQAKIIGGTELSLLTARNTKRVSGK